MVRKKKVVKTEVWPKVDKGVHLTVYTYENGSTELVWDDDALLDQVRKAIASVKKPSKKTAATKKAK
jgi:hypothetical protein